MGTIVVTGAASGMGAATAARLTSDGHRVIGVDQRDAEIVADLATSEGRRSAIDRVAALSEGGIQGLVPFAGLAGLPGRSGGLLVSVNYFGTIELLAGLRELLAAGAPSAAVAISSNSTTAQPGIPLELVDACRAGDEAAAREHGERVGSVSAYPATKMALARWVRHHAVRPAWIGAGITLNAIAPGLIDTSMTQEIRRDAVMGPLINQFPIPAGRPGRPEEIAALVSFLLGPDARFLCGSIVFADGGSDALLRPDDWPAPL